MAPRVSEQYKADRRQQILSAAELVFCQKGFQAAVMEDVIEAAAMSRGGVYQYFANKSDLLLGLLEARDAAINAELERRRRSGAACWEVLTEILQVLEQRLHTLRDSLEAVFVEYVVARWRDPAQRQYLDDRFARNLAPFAALIRDGVRSGEFTPQQPVEQIVLFLASHWDGLVLGTLLVGPDPIAIASQMAQLRTLLAQLLGVCQTDKESGHA